MANVEPTLMDIIDSPYIPLPDPSISASGNKIFKVMEENPPDLLQHLHDYTWQIWRTEIERSPSISVLATLSLIRFANYIPSVRSWTDDLKRRVSHSPEFMQWLDWTNPASLNQYQKKKRINGHVETINMWYNEEELETDWEKNLIIGVEKALKNEPYRDIALSLRLYAHGLDDSLKKSMLVQSSDPLTISISNGLHKAFRMFPKLPYPLRVVRASTNHLGFYDKQGNLKSSNLNLGDLIHLKTYTSTTIFTEEKPGWQTVIRNGGFLQNAPYDINRDRSCCIYHMFLPLGTEGIYIGAIANNERGVQSVPGIPNFSKEWIVKNADRYSEIIEERQKINPVDQKWRMLWDQENMAPWFFPENEFLLPPGYAAKVISVNRRPIPDTTEIGDKKFDTYYLYVFKVGDPIPEIENAVESELKCTHK